MQQHAAHVHFASSKNCFLVVPASWKYHLNQDQVAVAEVRYGDDMRAYLSVVGESSGTQAASGNEVVELNGLFASKLGLQHDEEVLVSPVLSVASCTKVYVEPLSVDDWEILELHAAFIEGNLLNQLRVVWQGLVFPVWVQKSICVFVRIGKMEPENHCTILEQLTEVVVTPKSRPQTSLPNPNLLTSYTKPTLKKQEPNKETHNKIVESNPWEKTEKSKKSNRRSDLEFVENDLIPNAKNHTSIGQRLPEKISEPFSFIDRFYRTLEGYFYGEENSESDGADCGRGVYTSELCSSIEGVLRIQPMIEPCNQPRTSNEESSSNYFQQINFAYQPTTAFITRRTWEMLRGAGGSDINPKPVIVNIQKLLSPNEEEKVGEKTMPKSAAMTRVKRVSLNGEKDGSKPEDAVKSTEPESQGGVVVRLVVLDGSGVYCSQSGSFGAGSGWSLCDGHVALQDGVRCSVGLDVTGKARVSPVEAEARELKEILLHPLQEMPPLYTAAMVTTAFRQWLSSSSNQQHPLVASQGTIIQLMLSTDLVISCLLSFTSVSQESQPDSPEYYLLTSDLLDKVSLKVMPQATKTNYPRVIGQFPVENVADLDPKVPRVKLKQLGGVSRYADEAVNHMEICLLQKPLPRCLFAESPGLCSGGLLVTGSRGCGKSTLTRALCRQVAVLPNLAYVGIVDCKPLRGKRIDGILKAFEKVFKEASWRQPAAILLDDLDQLTSAPSGPEQEVGGEATYYTRVAEILKDLLTEHIIQKSKVVVIATSRSRSSLHQSLVASRGFHLFQEVIHIHPPDMSQRLEMLKAIILSKTRIDADTLGTVDVERLAAATEGYVARDLDMVVERALHAHITKKGGASIGQQEVLLREGAFEAAMLDYTPASLRNVPLHTAGELGWGDIGGLSDVRNTLVETLQWPAKYPAVFAKCPLRLRSGLLLYGAPGTGKTLLAGVVANECGLNFITIKGPELLSKYIGASEQAVRDTFARAQSAKPCILFFDEFDSIAPRRGHDSTGVTDRVVNQLLTQLDGVEGLDGVYVLAATSRPDLIDPALLRPGRLDKALCCTIPNKHERLEILQALTRHMVLAADVHLPALAQHCQHFTGADFKALLYNAQLQAIHELTGHLIEGATRQAKDAETENSSMEGGVVSLVMEKDKARRSSWSAVVYIPRLEDGCCLELEEEKAADILAEIKCMELNVSKGSQWQDEGTEDDKNAENHVTIINQSHLLKAASTMGPSVTQSERHKYQMIYESFVASRGGNFAEATLSSGDKRATLA